MTETITYADALKRINAWREANACTSLGVLPDLNTHCEECGFAYTEKDMGGARCLSCGTSISASPVITDRPEPEATQRIYVLSFVLSFAPSYEEAADGGCEWRYEWDGILEMLRDSTMITPGYDYRVTTLDLPASMTKDEVTDFLGGRGTEVVDPPEPRSDLADALSDWNDDGNDPTCPECEAQGATQYLPCPAHPTEVP